jgi:hypothetical protein
MNIIKILQELIFNNNSSIKDVIKSLNKTEKKNLFIKSNAICLPSGYNITSSKIVKIIKILKILNEKHFYWH